MFENRNREWIGDRFRVPQYRASCHIEFRPASGDASAILRTHLGAEWDLKAVSDDPGGFSIFASHSDTKNAATDTNKKAQQLKESLEKFGLGTYFRIISPAQEPETPWMGEDAPPFDPTHP